MGVFSIYFIFPLFSFICQNNFSFLLRLHLIDAQIYFILIDFYFFFFSFAYAYIMRTIFMFSSAFFLLLFWYYEHQFFCKNFTIFLLLLPLERYIFIFFMTKYEWVFLKIPASEDFFKIFYLGFCSMKGIILYFILWSLHSLLSPVFSFILRFYYFTASLYREKLFFVV